jgi:hypothetical protein
VNVRAGQILEGVAVLSNLANKNDAMQSLKECKCRRTTRRSVVYGWTKRKNDEDEGVVEVVWKVEVEKGFGDMGMGGGREGFSRRGLARNAKICTAGADCRCELI